MAELHNIEHTADIKARDGKKLAAEFLPPIDRDDLVSLSSEIDDITDSIEDVLMRISMYNIKVIREDAIELAKLVVNCCEELRDIMAEFKNFKSPRKSTSISSR